MPGNMMIEPSAAARPQPPALPSGAAPAQARKAAVAFEAFFLARMLEPMFAGVSADGMFGGGQAEEVFNSMLIDQYGRLIAERGGIGLADRVLQEMLKSQEVAAP